MTPWRRGTEARRGGSRTTTAALLTHGLDSSYGIVTAILGHRSTASGELEFEVQWQDGTTSFSDASTLSKVTTFKDYVTQYKVTLAAPRSSGGSKRGRGR